MRLEKQKRNSRGLERRATTLETILTTPSTRSSGAMPEITICLLFCVVEPAPVAPASDYCQIAQPIYWHKDDTRRTKEQADTHNRVWKSICGGKQ